jgi:TetR/AcrR family transcriptional repressor of lmrAB and yxaGH operons
MRPPLLSRDEVIHRLREVFRAHGFEGATMSRISEATGLRRASLYHHFPGGKEEMARVVFADAVREFVEAVLAPLRAPGDAPQRMRGMAEGLRRYYRGGSAACLIGVFSLTGAHAILQKELAGALRALIDAVATALAGAGVEPSVAQQRAEDAAVRIQGALVVCRALGETAPFERVLGRLPGDLLGAE